MKAHQSLYDIIISSGYSTKEKLQAWIDEGSVKSKKIHSSQADIVINIEYIVNILIEDTNNNELEILFLITWWLNIYQPERKKEAFTFEVDHKNKKTSDVYLRIPIIEKVRSKIKDNGDMKLETCQPAVTIDDSISNIEIWLRNNVTKEEEKL